MSILVLIIGAAIAGIILAIYWVLLFKNRLVIRPEVPKDVVLLYQIGRGPHAPSISPFPLKLETFLRMAKIPYMNDHSAKFSSKGKTPWMQYNGQAIPDSQFCLEHLKNERCIDVNSNYLETEIASSRAFQKMAEENLYWTMCAEMFGEDTRAVETVIPYRGFKLKFTLWFLRRVLRKEMWGHGIGRHTQEEIWSVGRGDMTAISNFLGEKSFLLGAEPCEADCAVFGMLAMILWNMPTSRHERLMRDDLPNLVAYCERMKARYWPDWEERTLKGAKYINDSGKIYFEKRTL